MLIMLVVDILVCPGDIINAYYDAAKIRPTNYLN